MSQTQQIAWLTDSVARVLYVSGFLSEKQVFVGIKASFKKKKIKNLKCLFFLIQKKLSHSYTEYGLQLKKALPIVIEKSNFQGKLTLHVCLYFCLTNQSNSSNFS